MITPNAQLLVLFGSSLALKKPQAKEADTPTPYRSFCADCDEAGLDARHPCPGH